MSEAAFFAFHVNPQSGKPEHTRFGSNLATIEYDFGVFAKCECCPYRILRRNKVGWVELYFTDHPNFLHGFTGQPLLPRSRPDVVDFENCGKPYKVEFFGKTQKEGVSEEIKKRMAEIEALVVPDNMTYLEEASFPPDDTLPEVVKARVEHVQKKAVSRVRAHVMSLIDERIKTCHELPFSITKAEIEKAVPEFKGAFSSVVDMAKEHVKTLKEGDKHKYEAWGDDSNNPGWYDSTRWDLIRIYIEDKVPKPKDITEKQNEPAKSEEDAKKTEGDAKKQKVDSGEHFNALWRVCLDIGGKIERQDGPVVIEESDVKKLVPSYTGTFDLVYDTVKDYVNFRWAQYCVRQEFINSRNPTRYGGGSDGSYDIFIEKKTEENVKKTEPEFKKQKVYSDADIYEHLARYIPTLILTKKNGNSPIVIEETDIKRMAPFYTGSFDLVYEIAKQHISHPIWENYRIRRAFIDRRNPKQYGGGSDGSFDILIEKRVED